MSGQYSSYGYGAAIGAVHSRFAVTNALAMRNTGGQAPVATWGDSENYRNKSMPFELYNCTFADNLAAYGFIAKGWVNGWTGKNLIVDGQFFSMALDGGRAFQRNCANNWWCGDSADLAQTPEFAPHLVRGYVPAKGSGADRANAGWRPWQVTLDASELATREVRVGSLAELAAAFADLRDGDTVRIAEGTYTMDPQAPFAYMISNRIDVAIIGEGAGVTFDGDGGALATTFLTVADSFNVRIENISLRNVSIPWTASTQTPPLAVNVFRSGHVEVEAMSLESLRIVVTGNGINATAGGLISCHTVDAFVMFHDLVVRDVDFDATKAPSATTVAGLAKLSAETENASFCRTIYGEVSYQFTGRCARKGCFFLYDVDANGNRVKGDSIYLSDTSAFAKSWKDTAAVHLTRVTGDYYPNRDYTCKSLADQECQRAFYVQDVE